MNLKCPVHPSFNTDRKGTLSFQKRLSVILSPPGGGGGGGASGSDYSVGTQPTGMHSCFYFLLGRDKIPFPVKDFPFFQTHSGCDGYARFSWQALHALSKKQLYWFHLHLVKRYCSLYSSKLNL